MPAAAPNTAVQAAQGRRAGAVGAEEARIEWFIKEVVDNVNLKMKQRVSIATQFLKTRVVKNISVAVTKGTGPRGGRVVTGRSVAGEYPHAETTQLMKTIFMEVKEVQAGVFEGYVGTPLDYGLILETKMDRSFLVRTLREVFGDIKRITTSPIA